MTKCVSKTKKKAKAKAKAQSIGYWGIFLQFLHFGLIAWGGPAVQIALIRDELIVKKKWIKGKKFNRALAVYQALPGPEATKMCIYLGIHKKDKLGGLLAGLGFVFPGFVAMMALSLLYTYYGASLFLAVFAGVQPVIAALMVRAMHRISAHLIRHNTGYVAALYAFVAIFLGIHFLWVFIACGLFVAWWDKSRHIRAVAALIALPLLYLGYAMVITTVPVLAEVDRDHTMLMLLWTGLKAGAFSFGGAYTTIPIFSEYVVENNHWLTEKQFLDGFAIISILPAPVTMFSVFIGVMTMGMWGGVVMAISTFLPAFAIALWGNGFIKKLIKYKKMRRFLEGVVGGVIGLFSVTALKIGMASITDWKTGLIALSALVMLYMISSRFVIPLCIIVASSVGVAFL